MKADLFRFPDPISVAQVAARHWGMMLEQSEKTETGFAVALSGGRIAGLLFDAVVQELRSKTAALERLHFFWADERCVPPSDVESNYGLARQRLLEPLGVAEERIHRIQGEIDPREAALLAEAELRSLSPPDARFPLLDLVILGMGPDGHVASLFPERCPRSMDEPRWYLDCIGPKPPPRRVTLGYGPILAARKVMVLITGDGKQQALHKALAEDETLPLGRVIRGRQTTLILTDLSL